jgi:hypothetical protein
MNLDGLHLYGGHDVPAGYSDNYGNMCQVKQLKYFSGVVCTGEEINSYADFSSSNMVDYVPTCSDGPTASCEEDNCDIALNSSHGTSGSSYTIMAWVNCNNYG